MFFFRVFNGQRRWRPVTARDGWEPSERAGSGGGRGAAGLRAALGRGLRARRDLGAGEWARPGRGSAALGGPRCSSARLPSAVMAGGGGREEGYPCGGAAPPGGAEGARGGRAGAAIPGAVR